MRNFIVVVHHANDNKQLCTINQCVLVSFVEHTKSTLKLKAKVLTNNNCFDLDLECLNIMRELSIDCTDERKTHF